MPKRILLALIMVMQAVTLSGCWDYRDINTVAFPQLGAYDLHEDGETSVNSLSQDIQLIDLTVVIPNIAENVESKFKIDKTTGILIGNARGQKPYQLPGGYTPGVASSIIIGEDLAATGINKLNEALTRGALNPHTLNYAISEGRAEKILRVPVKDYPSMGVYMRLLLRSADKRAFIATTTLHQFEVDQNPGKNPIMPLLTIKNDKVKFSGTAILKKDKMIGRADLEETQYLLMLRGIKCTASLPFVLNNYDNLSEYGSVNVVNKRKVKVEHDGDKFIFNISIMLEGELTEIDRPEGILFTENEELIHDIEAQISSDVTDKCKRFLKKMQGEYKVDCIDISKYALAKWRKELEPRIDEDFIENVVINVNVTMKMKDIGEEN